MARRMSVAMEIEKIRNGNRKTRVMDIDDNYFIAFIQGDVSTPYVHGIFEVHISLPVNYPSKGPKVKFNTPIFHPNIDAVTGEVSLEILDEKWNYLYTLENVIDDFLPHLLKYANLDKIINPEAAFLFMLSNKRFHKKAMRYVRKYAKVIDAVFRIEESEEISSECLLDFNTIEYNL